jgi:hypothetical protein
MGLITLEPQNTFPHEDVSDTNADMLELLLLNREAVELGHASAEKVSYLYQIGHKALAIAAAPHLNDDERYHAFSYGIATFEAVAAFVRPQPDAATHSNFKVNFKVMNAHRQVSDDFFSAMGNARDAFADQVPRTKLLIGQSAARFYRQSAIDSALTGAALARQLEIDATAA